MAQTINNVTTRFVGNYYELTGSQVTKYYFAGATRVAMRKYTIPQAMNLEYLLADHLGSTSLTTDTNGAKVSEMRYKPWGELRYTWTSNPATAPVYALTRYTFTGQYSYLDDPVTSASEGFGLMFYNARWLDPVTGRFAQADSIIPESQGTQAWDRFAFVNNNPVRYTDPTGHRIDSESEMGGRRGNSSTNNRNGDDAHPPCADAAGVEIMCISLTGGEGGQADVLEDQLDSLGDILDPLSIASSFIGITTSIATTIAVAATGAPILSSASAALFLGLTGPELLIAGGLVLAALGVAAAVTSYEMGQISENMDESLITSTGGTLTVSSVGGVFYTYTITDPAGKEYRSYSITNVTPFYIGYQTAGYNQ